MNNNCLYLGIDVSKLKLDVALPTPDAQHTECFSNDAPGFQKLTQWLARFTLPIHACLEATGVYGLPVARFLHQRGFKVSIVNPMTIHFFARTQMSRNKTDSHDAALIARYAQCHAPRAWQPPSPAKERLQQLVRTREQLLESQVLAQQYLESASALGAKHFKALIRHLDGQLKRLERDLRQAVQADQSLQQAVELLQSIPGIGLITAVTVLSIMPDIEQLEEARQLAAFAGVTPCQKQSGLSAGKTRMSKFGHSRLRKALYFPALTALRHNPRAQALAIRLSQKGKGKMVILGAVMRLLTHLIYGVLKHQRPFDPNYENKTSHRAAASLQLAPGGG